MSGEVAQDKCCEKCGRFDAVEIGDTLLCEECITLAGCACAEKESGDRI